MKKSWAVPLRESLPGECAPPRPRLRPRCSPPVLALLVPLLVDEPGRCSTVSPNVSSTPSLLAVRHLVDDTDLGWPGRSWFRVHLVLLGLVVDYLLFAGELGASGAAHLVHLGGSHHLNLRLELLLLLESAGGIASLRGDRVELVRGVL